MFYKVNGDLIATKHVILTKSIKSKQKNKIQMGIGYFKSICFIIVLSKMSLFVFVLCY